MAKNGAKLAVPLGTLGKGVFSGSATSIVTGGLYLILIQGLPQRDPGGPLFTEEVLIGYHGARNTVLGLKVAEVVPHALGHAVPLRAHEPGLLERDVDLERKVVGSYPGASKDFSSNAELKIDTKNELLRTPEW